jgi:hypothetical protein
MPVRHAAGTPSAIGNHNVNNVPRGPDCHRTLPPSAAARRR